MPVSADIENANVSDIGLHRSQAKIQSSKTVFGDGTRRKPLGTVNFQSAKPTSKIGGKHCGADKKDFLGASSELAAMKTVKSEHRSGQQCISQTKENICCVFVDDSTEEKEFMHVAANVDNDDDDYRDLWPTQEQPATYLKNIMTWQPPVSIQHAPLPSVSPPSFSELDDDDGQCDDFFYRI